MITATPGMASSSIPDSIRFRSNLGAVVWARFRHLITFFKFLTFDLGLKGRGWGQLKIEPLSLIFGGCGFPEGGWG